VQENLYDVIDSGSDSYNEDNEVTINLESLILLENKLSRISDNMKGINISDYNNGN
jgi:hypothetical protein